jgi:hypothetical protein
MPNKNDTPEQKAAWEARRRASGSRFIRFTPAYLYNPPSKPPSRRDTHRARVAQAKERATKYE